MKLVGHDAQVTAFRSAADSGRLHHAWLFTGPEGVGKASFTEAAIAEKVLKEIQRRLGLLRDVGLDYLSLDRLSSTLSGGEAQRINLATSLGSALVGTLYVLDEPSIGLHSRDNLRLIDILRLLRDQGNTVLVVEHDADMIKVADHIVDLGPGAGETGGKVIFDLGAIAARIRDAAPEADIVLIADMPRDEVYGHFASSRLFVDLGSFPGKDRMAREALSLGANVVIAAAGAGRHAEDYRFPDAYRWRMADIDELVALAVDMLRRPEDHSRKFDPARVAIRNEKAVFEVETRAAFGLSGGET